MALVRAAHEKASSSNATSPFPSRYHVFLSFRGEDTRKTFTDHLYTAFVDQGFRTFRDDDELERGEYINSGLDKAIQQSRSSVIVFSKHYASSRWCLDELVMILEQKRTSDHVVLPVFYNVEPSQVRKQTGSFGEAFARHQKTQPSHKVKEWRAALKKVADLAGMVLQHQADGYESTFIKKVVKVIGDKISRTPLSVVQNLIGMQSRVESINLWLRDGSTDVGMLVIYGMSGIGKTTIAKSIYNSNFSKFEGSSFLESIREISEQPNGLVQIQLQLISDILNGREVKIHNVSEGIIKIGDAISSKKVLLVLDDVDHMDQLDAVLRMKDQFYPGSKIIITTRRTRLLKAHQATKVHFVETLGYNESLELFSWHAFGQDHPIECYKKLSEKVVRHAGGLPLALQVLGSSLSGETADVWESALEKLQTIPHREIVQKLRISYDSLQDDHDQELLLHIACFLIGKEKHVIVRILNGCGFYTIVGIQNLIERCLVTIDKHNKVQMHDMIRDMGREIVRLESKDPEKRSRLWHHEDSHKVLREKNGTHTIEGLVLNMHMHRQHSADTPSNIFFETHAFSRMHKLRLLNLSYVQFNGCYEEFPKGLIWLCWIGFPLDSIPIDFSLESLVVLEMHHSSLRRVWKGTKCLPSLKILDLSYSHCLTKTADFSLCPNLEKLILIHCASLIDVNSIGNLKRLVYLNMKDCKNLRKLPENIFVDLKLLETLIISGCSNLNEFPVEMMRNMEFLKVLETDGIQINQLLETHREFKSLPGNRSLSIFLTSLPSSLVALSLRGCNLLDDSFPMDFGSLSSLKRLHLGDNPISSLPNCIRGLTCLDELNFYDCSRLKSLIQLPKLHCDLTVEGCLALERITFQSITGQAKTTGVRANNSLVEIEYDFKLEPIVTVDVEMLNLLALCNLDLESMPSIRMHNPCAAPYQNQSPIQGVYQYGIFSTYLPGNEVPGQFSHRSSEGSCSISFTVPLPLLANLSIRGLNIFIVYANADGEYYDGDYSPDMNIIKVRNKSKGLKWMYGAAFYGIPGEGEDMMWLSHWNMENQLQGGDQVVVSLLVRRPDWFKIKEWGIQVVQEDLDQTITTKQDPHFPRVIGGDLSRHEVMPGTYLLCSTIEEPEELEEIVSGMATWFNDLNRDSDDDEDTDKEEEQKMVEGDHDHDHSLSAKGGWKMCSMIMAAGFFLTLALLGRSSLSRRNKSRQSVPSMRFL